MYKPEKSFNENQRNCFKEPILLQFYSNLIKAVWFTNCP